MTVSLWKHSNDRLEIIEEKEIWSKWLNDYSILRISWISQSAFKIGTFTVHHSTSDSAVDEQESAARFTSGRRSTIVLNARLRSIVFDLDVVRYIPLPDAVAANAIEAASHHLMR